MKRHHKCGLTIIEMLISAFLIAVTLILVYNFYILANNTSHYAFVQSSMQQEAMLCLERMIRGVDNVDRKGIQEAQDITTPAVGDSGTQIEFVDQADTSISRQFYLSTNRVVYQDENGNTRDLVHGNVQSLTFSRPQEDLVGIALSLQKTVLGKNISVDLFTAVKLRNN